MDIKLAQLPVLQNQAATKFFQEQNTELSRYNTKLLNKLSIKSKMLPSRIGVFVKIQEMFAGPNGNIICRLQLNYVDFDRNHKVETLNRWLRSNFPEWQVKQFLQDGRCLLVSTVGIKNLSNKISISADLEKITQIRRHNYQYVLANNIVASYDATSDKSGANRHLISLLPQCEKQITYDLEVQYKNILKSVSVFVSAASSLSDLEEYNKVIKAYKISFEELEIDLKKDIESLKWRRVTTKISATSNFIAASRLSNESKATKKIFDLVNKHRDQYFEKHIQDTDKKLATLKENIKSAKPGGSPTKLKAVINYNDDIKALEKVVKDDAIQAAKSAAFFKVPPAFEKFLDAVGPVAKRISKIDKVLALVRIGSAEDKLQVATKEGQYPHL